MKKKIIITGGLGYIGTELCKIYSGVSWHHKITVIDNRFISERVNQIRNWNMEFIHGDILDKELIKKYCEDADVVHHLAGVTNVPRTKSEATSSNDNKIKEVAEKGTQNILDVISDNCKIIFPSTHVVYEGINEVKTDIKENEITKPVFSSMNLKHLATSIKGTRLLICLPPANSFNVPSCEAILENKLGIISILIESVEYP